MQGRHLIWAARPFVLALAFTLLGAVGACGGAPCAELVERVCAATDTKACDRTKVSVGGDSPSPSQQKACAAVLDHEQTLEATIELMKSRSAQ